MQNIRNVLLYVAKNAASGAFGLIFLYTSELFPTSVRSSGIGACSLMARVGALATPYMGDLADLAGDRVPYYILGGFAGEVLKCLQAIMVTEKFQKNTRSDIKLQKYSSFRV